MSYESFDEYQYDSCISRGICTINPRLSALQTIIVLYLRFFAKYAKKLELDKETKNFVLNTLSITIYNPEFNENSFFYAIKIFQEELPRIMAMSAELDSEIDLESEKEKILVLFKETSDVIQSIRYGERVIKRSFEKIPTKIRDLYNIVLVIAKSLSINLLDLESFDKENQEAFPMILNLLCEINLEISEVEALKLLILEAAKIDIQLMKLLREAQEERYGKQGVAKVSYSTVPNKATLVVGSNIKELETILDALEDKDIDVYTHDDMMLAHTFPRFLEYKHLKGQFGQGVENCLLDFATFPGPIILTKHSLHNIENFYRGRLFTTDYMTAPKGIIKIEADDFSKVIKSAELSKGFKTGKQCEEVVIGYNYEDIINKIKDKLDSNNYEQIFIIGLEGYSLEQKAYFEKLTKLTPQNILIISFSYNSEKENLIHINTCFDNFSWIKIFEFLNTFELGITIFVPKCERGTLSQMIYFSDFKNVNLFVGKCTPIVLNPSLLTTLQEVFKIQSVSTFKKDLKQIIEDK